LAFTDPSLGAGATPVKFAHLNQLRDAVQAVRLLAGLTPASFSGSAIGLPISSSQILELRNALSQAHSTLLLPPLTFANSASALTFIRATDVTELRNGVQ
ncbi:MAG TPA: hypothetical protein VF215_12495, partial [Thermoanaerobaculia bacterium]